MKLTEAAVKSLALKQGEADRIWFDDDVHGFGARMRSSGAAVWVYQYKLGTKQRRMTFGDLSAMSAKRARAIAEDLRAQVRQGGDPVAEKHAGKMRAADTFEALMKAYLDHQEAQLRPGSYAEVKRHLHLHSKPLQKLPLASVDQRTIADRLRAIAKGSGDVTSNRVRSTLSAMFAWGMGEGLAVSNPVTNTNKREERARDRILSDAELKIIWDALDDDQYGAIVKLLILTAQRENEIAGLGWSEIDFDRALISLPAERTKNARPHVVPLASTAVTVLKRQERSDNRDLVFGRRGGPFSGWSKAKATLDARIEEQAGKSLPHWTLHDLRRTGATRMAEIGILPHVVEAVLNHVSGHKAGVAGIYNRATYGSEKAQALARWDEHVLAFIESGRAKVMPLLKRA